MKIKRVYLLFILVPFLGFARTIKVGSNLKLRTLSSAVEAASAGDTILLNPGIYKTGNIVIDKPLFIKGIGFPVLDGENKCEIITVKSGSVTISGLVIKNSGKSSLEDIAAIKIKKASNVTIAGNRLENNYFGIYLAGCKNCIVSENKITGAGLTQQSSGNGIHLWKCNKISISSNECRGHRDGIYFEFVTESRIINNQSENNLRYGLHFMFSDNNTYEDNTFKANGAGVAVMYSKKVVMKRNHFQFNWGSGAYGLLLKDIRDSEIMNNTFEGNTTGIYAESASRINISKNILSKNGWALRVTSSCDGINITENNFVANTFDMATTSYNTITANSYDGNYWDKYEGYDLNKDNKGDIPYHPVHLSAVLVEKIPTSGYFLHSFMLDLINETEKMIPNLVPEGIKDNAPALKKFKL